jgi:hypothetical protein
LVRKLFFMALVPVLLFSLLLHVLVGWRVAPDLFAVYAPLGFALWAVLLISAVLVPMGVLARRVAKPPLADVLTWLGLLCMGLFSTLFVLTALRELLLLLARTIDWLWPAVVSIPALRADTALALPVVGLLLTVLGFWNARRTATVVQVDVPIANLPEALHGFTVAQISDIHVGPTIKTQYLQRIVDRVNGLNANMVAITGDLVDGSVRELGHHVAPLAQLASTHGTFFVTGNHEYYSGAHSWIDALRGLGIQVLMNEHVLIHHSTDTQDPEPAVIVVAGVADFSAHHFDEAHRSDPHAAIDASAAQRGRGIESRVRPATIGPHAWRPVLALDAFCETATAVYCRSAQAGSTMGIHQPGYRLLGAAQALWRAFRDHAPAAGQGLSLFSAVLVVDSGSTAAAPDSANQPERSQNCT